MAPRRTYKGRAWLPGEGIVREVLLRCGVAVAGAYRRRLDRTTFVGVTGSCGKTTTKELIVATLGSSLRGTHTPGGSNALSGIGRTILRTRPRHRFCAVEAAAWYPGSIADAARLLRPQIAVVTTVGLDHYKAFRGREGTAAEKRALVAALPEDGTAILNADDPYVIAMADGFKGRVISVGESPAATLRAENVRSAWPDTLTFTLKHEGQDLDVVTQLNGKYWITSVLAALGVAVTMKVPLESAVATVESFQPVPGRMSRVESGGVAFVRDDRKAPLWSFDALFEYVADARARRKIFVIGTVSDYPGGRSQTYRKIARDALAVGDEAVFVGGSAQSALGKRTLPDGGPLHVFATVREAYEYLRSSLQAGDLVVLKGSHKQDHLQRIPLAWSGDIECWRMNCGRLGHCDECRLLHVPGGS